MNITKKFAAAGLAAALCGLSSFADVEVTPYGAAQYRLRFQHNMAMPDEGDNLTSFDYTNRLCWRTGTKVKVDDNFSLQFQFGNDWGAAENVDWNSNHSPFGRVGNTHNFYAHLAYARWNPGFMFIEAGIVPLKSSGTLDLLANSILDNRYTNAGWNGWGDANESVIGLKVGAPVVKEGVKVGVELTQAIVERRTQTMSDDPKSNPPSMLFDLQIPVEAGAIKITPEVTMVTNRNFNSTTEEGDMEMLFGFAGSFKASDKISLGLNFGYGMVSNENSQAGVYGTGGGRTASAENVPDFVHYSSQGMLVGADATIRKVGPGDLRIAVNYNSAENTEADDNGYGQLYTDIRYPIKLHKNFTFTPRYRTYTYLVPGNTAGYSGALTTAGPNGARMDNRFELIFEGSF